MMQHPAFVLRDTRTGQEYPVPPGGLRIGRTSQNDVVLSDDQVSRNHATLWSQDAQLTIRDEDSTNGTWVNEERISAPRVLQEGDQVRIGDTLFQVAAGVVPGVPAGMAAATAGSSFPLVPAAIAGGVLVLILIGVVLGNKGGAAATPATTVAPTPTGSPTISAAPTNTSAPTATSASRPPAPPTATPIAAPQAQQPELIAPAQGQEYSNPVAFQWSGALRGGQAYQVTAYHPESNERIQSGLLLGQEWRTGLPAERFGEWRWTVTVIDGGQAVATSAEWMFWFQPLPGIGGGSGPDRTATPEFRP